MKGYSVASRDSDGNLLLLGCVGGIAIIPLIRVLEGWALSILWEWFVVPVFHLPSLTIARAIGVAIVVAMLTHENQDCKKADDHKPWAALVGYLIGPFAALGIGWIVRQFV